MTEEEAVRQRLLDTPAVTALVGTRVYLLKLPQTVILPAIRVLLIDVVDSYHLRGGSLTKRSRVQTDTIANEASGGDPYAEVLAVSKAVHDTLSGRVFTYANSVSTITLTGPMRVDRFPLYEAAELRQVRMVQDYIVWSRETSPTLFDATGHSMEDVTV